jgi:dTDP-4-dehydrorhamnose reductase
VEEGRPVKVLVTGCNGQLGADAVEFFRSAGHEVTGCDLPQVDITSPDQIAGVVRSSSPDAVLHAAAMTDVDGCERDPDAAFMTNALGTRNVAVACQQSGAALVYISTDFVFDGTGRRPYREFDAPRPLCVYGSSKLAGEQYVRHLVSRHMVVRTAWLFGPRGRNFVRSILEAAGRGTHLRVVNDQVGSPTYSRHLAATLVRLVETGLWGTYHATNTGSTSWWAFAVEILRCAGLGGRTVDQITSGELRRPARRPTYSVLDLSALEETLGERMPHWRDALREFLEGPGRSLVGDVEECA